jgi:hypothetical protein
MEATTATVGGLTKEEHIAILQEQLKEYGAVLELTEVAKVLKFEGVRPQRKVEALIDQGLLEAVPISGVERKRQKVTQAALIAYMLNTNKQEVIE